MFKNSMCTCTLEDSKFQGNLEALPEITLKLFLQMQNVLSFRLTLLIEVWMQFVWGRNCFA